MTEKKNIIIIILISLLVISIACAGRELAKQTIERESLARELSEIKKEVEIKEKTSFVQCQEIRAHKDDLINILLLNAIELKPGRDVWDIAVIEPNGFGIGIKDIYLPAPLRDTPTMEAQIPVDINEDGVMDRIVATIHRKIGDYLIIVRPSSNVSPSDTYDLWLRRALRETYILAENIPYTSNLLNHFYILRQTETGIIPIVPASIGCQF